MTATNSQSQRQTAVALFPELAISCPAPHGQTAEQLLRFLQGFRLGDAHPNELHGYLAEGFNRFLTTLQLIPKGKGRMLEVGANPYFFSALIRQFTQYELHCVNYFGADHPRRAVQVMSNDELGIRYDFEYQNVNVEVESPECQEHFDVIMFCEVIEHLTHDPLKAVVNLKRVLKPGGWMIVTTPNVSRLWNVAAAIAGVNIYDPYSAYGPYGRHNREYNKHELNLLFCHAGFAIDLLMSADVHLNESHNLCELQPLVPLLRHRAADLGQYLFARMRNDGTSNPLKPSWLYRSYAPEELDSSR